MLLPERMRKRRVRRVVPIARSPRLRMQLALWRAMAGAVDVMKKGYAASVQMLEFSIISADDGGAGGGG